MKKHRNIIKVITVISIIITAVSAASDFLIRTYIAHRFKAKISPHSSIGIIGGADGPTSIFVAGDSSHHLITILFGLLSVAGAMYLVLSRKSRKKDV